MNSKQAIMEESQAFLRAFNLRRPTEIADCFVAEGQILPAYCRVIRGREAIASFWQGLFGIDEIAMARQSFEIQVYTEWGYETGSYVLRRKDDIILDQGKYLVIWHQLDGTWKRYREIWNSSPPD